MPRSAKPKAAPSRGRAPSSSPTPPPGPPEQIEWAAETLIAQVTNHLLDFLQKESGTPWEQRTEADQARVINRTKRWAEETVDEAVRVIAADGRTVLSGKVKKVDVGDQIKVQVIFDREDSLRHRLYDSQGQVVLLVVTEGVDRYSRAGELREPTPDQPPLGLPAPDRPASNGAGLL